MAMPDDVIQWWTISKLSGTGCAGDVPGWLGCPEGPINEVTPDEAGTSKRGSLGNLVCCNNLCGGVEPYRLKLSRNLW